MFLNTANTGGYGEFSREKYIFIDTSTNTQHFKLFDRCVQFDIMGSFDFLHDKCYSDDIFTSKKNVVFALQLFSFVFFCFISLTSMGNARHLLCMAIKQ